MQSDILGEIEQQKIDKIRKDLQTPDAFRIWLQGLPISQLVGLSKTCDRCPISNYLKGRGIDSPLVRARGITYAIKTDIRGISILIERDNAAHNGILMMPRWIQDFIMLIDDEDQITQEITSAIALEAIEYILHPTIGR